MATEMRHEKWNIDYTAADSSEFENLNHDQARAIADMVNDLRRRLGETEFLLAHHENGWAIPEELKTAYPTNDYRPVVA